MNYIDYNFIEIGTCDFETLIEDCDDETVGISVEPLNYYLNNLPNKKNVKKINAAISIDNSESEIDIYYIPEHKLKENNLPLGLKGCNKIGTFHPHHIKRNITHLVEIQEVKQIPLVKLLTENNVRKIDVFKIDTEGLDCYILNQLFNYLKIKEHLFYPKKIIFETNKLTNIDVIQKTVDNFISIGYLIESRNDWKKDGNTILVFSN